MLFSSITFLYYFLPLMLAFYFASDFIERLVLGRILRPAQTGTPGKAKNIVLLLGSLIFYAWGEPRYVILMVVSILAGWFFGLLLEKYRGKSAGRLVCVLSVGISLSFLLYFKYGNFFLENLGAVTGQEIALIQAALPIGISFYTFQIISYTLDVYRGERAERNLINLAAYITMFPQLIAGPIVRYAGIAGRMEKRGHSWEEASEGIRRFVIGLAKKILLANQLGELCGVFRASSDKSVLFYWLYATALILQIYFDFSGYSDMAIGLGRVLGFHFPENFNYPYISASITEFWRRWHITLGSWFRDYVYIPMGGNRVGKGRWLFNIFVVWMLTGFWHGAAWNFIIWGLYFAVLLMAEKLWLLKYLKKSRILSRIYVLFLVTVSFVIFNGENMGQALSDIGGLFGAGGIPLVSNEAVYYAKSFAVILTAAITGATPAVRCLFERAVKRPAGRKLLNAAEPALLLVLTVIMTAYLVDGSFNPFLYFRF